jgi:hypothetical protein
MLFVTLLLACVGGSPSLPQPARPGLPDKVQVDTGAPVPDTGVPSEPSELGATR